MVLLLLLLVKVLQSFKCLKLVQPLCEQLINIPVVAIVSQYTFNICHHNVGCVLQHCLWCSPQELLLRSFHVVQLSSLKLMSDFVTGYDVSIIPLYFILVSITVMLAYLGRPNLETILERLAACISACTVEGYIRKNLLVWNLEINA